MRGRLLLVALLWGACVTAQTVEVPPEIANTYDQLSTAIASGDTETAQGHVTELARLQAAIYGQGDPEHILRLPELYRIESLKPTFTGCVVKGDRALTTYELKMFGTDKKTDERVERTWQCSDQLLRSQAGWLVCAHARIDPELARQQVTEGRFRNEQRGVEVAIPEGWVAYVPVGGPGTVLELVSPDLLSGATLLAVDMPVKAEAKAIVQAETQMIAAAGLNYQVLSQGDTTLAGGPAYGAVSKIVTAQQTVYSDSAFRIEPTAEGDILYALVVSSERGEPATIAKAEMELLRSSLKLTPPKPEELPAELGKITDGKYINSKYSVTMTLAEGWTPRISKSRFLFQLSLTPAEGQSTFLLGAVDIGQYIDPKLAAQGDLQAQRQIDPALKVLGEGNRDIQGTPGYQILAQFTLPGEQMRTRWSCYIMRGTILYFIVADAVPATDYDKVKDAWGKMVDSIGWVADEEG